MSLLTEFQEYKDKLNAAVADIMQTTVVKQAKEEISKQADAVVYSYGSSGMRRYSLKEEENYHETYSRQGDVHQVVIEGSHTFQGAPWGGYLSTVVEEGWSNWNQPGPRPYMKRTEEIMQEKVADIVASEVQARGL